MRRHTWVHARAEKRAGGLIARVDDSICTYTCARARARPHAGVNVTSTRERGRRLVWWFSIPFSSRYRRRGWRYCRCRGRFRARPRPRSDERAYDKRINQRWRVVATLRGCAGIRGCARLVAGSRYVFYSHNVFIVILVTRLIVSFFERRDVYYQSITQLLKIIASLFS